MVVARWLVVSYTHCRVCIHGRKRHFGPFSHSSILFIQQKQTKHINPHNLHISKVSILPDPIHASINTKTVPSITTPSHIKPISALNSQPSHLVISTPSLPSPATNGITPKHFPDPGYTLVVSTVRLLMNTSNTLTSKNSLISRSSGFDELDVEE